MKKNRFGSAVLLVTATLACISPAVDTALHNPADPQMGINFTHLMDWSPEYPFVNLLHNARPWTSIGNTWDDGRAIDEDENGYVKSLIPAEGTNKAQAVTTLIGTGGAAYPSGDYLFLFDGQAATTNIYFTVGATNVTVLGAGRWLVKCNSLNGDKAINMELKSIPDTNNYPRNMRLIMPGYHNYTNALDTNQVFTTAFLNRWQEFGVIRFLNWMKTNGSTVSNWAGRTPPGYLFYTKDSGAPYEMLIDLCNLTGANPWFTIPHLADDSFVTNFAALVKERLDTNLAVYVEYSNETWNGVFWQQRNYVNARGLEIWPELSNETWQAGQNWYGLRSAQIHSLCTNVFGGHDRIVRVVQGQAGGSGISEDMFAANPGLASNLDAYAVAPYIGMNVSSTSSGNTPTLAEFEVMDVDDIIDWMLTKTLPDDVFPSRMEQSYEFAQSNNLPLVTYEGGQSLTLKADTDYANTHGWKVAAVNQHPRMADVYMQYFRHWTQMGGGLFNVYSSSTEYITNGAWVMAFGKFWADDQPNDESPKYNALLYSGFLNATDEPRLMVNTNWITAPEGATGQFQLKLSSAPASAVTVAVSSAFGDTHITVDTPEIIFSTSDWDTWKPVTVFAEEDSDYNRLPAEETVIPRCDGTAVLRVRADGITDAGVIVYEDDNDFDPESSVPWSETFENDSTNSGTIGPLGGQRGWSASSTGAVVQASTAYNSTQAAELNDVRISRSFVDGQTSVWARLYLRPVYGQTNAGVTTASAAFWVGGTGQIMAYSNSTIVALPVAVAENVWSEFIVHLDYTAQRWSLRVNGTNVAGSLAFHSVKSGFQSLEIAQDDSGTAYADAIALSQTELTSDFQAPDSDGDTLPDWWETQYFGGATNASAGATASNGINTVLQCYIAGLNPTDADSLFDLHTFRPLSSANAFRWDGITGRLYSVYWSSNLLSGFELLQSNIAWTVNAYTDTVHGTASQGFYKVKVELQ